MISNKDFFIKGSNKSKGSVIDMTTEAADFFLSVTLSCFYICIETAAPIETQLEDGSLFTITAVQADAYLGRWYPASIKKVIKVGTTGKFSFGF